MSYPNLELFIFPRELRNMIFAELGKSSNRVAAFDKKSGIGILAYYDGHVLDESEITTYNQLRRKDDGAGRWRPSEESRLTTWLLSSKSTISESVKEFYCKAYWNVWPVGARHNFHYTSDIVKNMLM
jgi:hypothetical protein